MTEPRSVPEALTAIDEVLALPGITLLPTPADVTILWLDLLRQRPAAAKRVFDVQLAATMLSCDVGRICTYNTAHFSAFPGIEPVTPDSL
ncbi:MAG TPA: hypothetical protein PJ982_15955 [Lacipirellulaceae bacterium]|nr:hypothetical protein [Lacipirellulaceae bacterium]